MEFLSDLRLKPGLYALRLSASSDRLNSEGSVYTDVEVPDFEKLSLSASGVLVSSVPTPPAAPVGALTAITPVPPTTQREFARSHHASAFMRVYQGGKGRVVPVTLTARILNEIGEVVNERSEVLDVGRFDSERGADMHYELPLVELAPGRYLLRFDLAASGHALRRDVRFVVQ